MNSRHLIFAGMLALGLVLFSLLSLAQSAVAPRGRPLVEEEPLEEPLPPGVRVRAFIHRPRVVEPGHLGICSADDPNTLDTNYLLAGWHLPSTGITWKLNESTVPTSVGVSLALDTIMNSFSAWTQADTQKVFTYGGPTGARGARFDGVNAILWKRLSASTIAVTYIWYYTATGLVAEVDTLFNSRYPWAVFDPANGECQTLPDAYDLQDIATHEFGHWVGLDDLYSDADIDLTMYGFGAGGELKKRTLAPGDVDGANAVAP